MGDEVGSASFAVFPTFRGFRAGVTKESTASTAAAAGIFRSGFSKAGADAGRGFGGSFKSATATLTSDALKRATADVAKSSREVSSLRLKELDATGKVRVAEAQLADARRRYGESSSQVVRAEERLASAQRSSLSSGEALIGATRRLAAAQRTLTSSAAPPSGGGFFSRMDGFFSSGGSSAAQRFGSGFRATFPQIFGGNLLASVVTQGAFAIGQGIGRGIEAGLSYSFEAFGLASKLEQSVGAVQSVFDSRSAEMILGFSSDAARNVGLAQSSYQQFAVVVGAQLKNLGFPIEDVGTKTNDLIGLGADLAAQFGGSTSDAVGALSSLLRGERDPIERYGVSLKQADVNARVAAMGLGDLTDEGLKQAEVQATLALLWEQTAAAQGTFAREADTAAGKQQILQARLQDTQTAFGAALLEPGTRFLDFADATLLPKLEQVLTTLGPSIGSTLAEITPDVERIIDGTLKALPGIVAAMGDFVGFTADGLDVLQAIDQNDLFKQAQSQGQSFQQDVSGPFSEWAGDRLETYKENVNDFQESIGLAAPYATLQWEKYRTATDAALGASENDFSAYNNAIQDELNKLTVAAPTIGRSIPEGIANGVTDWSFLAVGAAGAMAEATLTRARAVLDSHSPSRKFERLAKDVVDGYAGGIDKWSYQAQQAAARMVSFDRNTAVMQPVSASSATAAAQGSDYPIMMEGGKLVGWVRGLATDQARLEIDDYDALSAGTISRRRRTR